MKKTILYIALLSIIIITTSTIVEENNVECDATALKLELKKKLKPDYKYDSSKTSRFTYKNKVQVKEFEVPLFMGEKYRFLFNSAGLPKNIKIEIFNKKIGNKKRKLLYTVDNKKTKQHIYIFEPEKSRKMFVNYTIPAAVEEESIIKGCVIFLVGYKFKSFK